LKQDKKVYSSCPLFKTCHLKHVKKINSSCLLFRTSHLKQDKKIDSSCPLFRTSHLKHDKKVYSSGPLFRTGGLKQDKSKLKLTAGAKSRGPKCEFYDLWDQNINCKSFKGPFMQLSLKILLIYDVAEEKIIFYLNPGNLLIFILLL